MNDIHKISGLITELCELRKTYGGGSKIVCQRFTDIDNFEFDTCLVAVSVVNEVLTLNIGRKATHHRHNSLNCLIEELHRIKKKHGNININYFGFKELSVIVTASLIDKITDSSIVLFGHDIKEGGYNVLVV